MAEIKTYSSAVDYILADVARGLEPSTQSRAKRAVRQTYRECAGLQIFYNDMTEDSIIVPSDNYVWEQGIDFRILRTAAYPPARYEIEFPPMIPPGKAQRDDEFYYYAGPSYHVFKGIKKDDELRLAYYSWPPHLKYYAIGFRPAIYDDETIMWTYLQSDGSYLPAGDPQQELDEQEQEAARKKVTNWLIFKWWDTIIEGSSTKVFNFLDDPRAPKAYSVYKEGQKTLSQGEPYDSLGR